MFIVIFVIVGLAVLILGHEAGHFFVAKLFGLKVEEFGLGFRLGWESRLTVKKTRETEYSINWLPFGGFVKIAGEEEAGSGELKKLEALPPEAKKRLFFFQPAWKRFLVIASGVVVNFLIGWLLISFVFMIGTNPLLVVSGIQRNSPAEQAGIVAGDIITKYTVAKNFIDVVNQYRGRPMTLEVRRGSKDLNFTVVPRVDTALNEGALGVLLSEAGVQRRGFFSSLQEGFTQSVYASGTIVVTFYTLIKNLLVHGSLLTGVIGPIGILSVAEETGKIGMMYLIQLIGFISINLAVINLIPFPALDGGRLFLILVEKIKGSPIPFKFQAWANGLGFLFLLTVIVLVSIRDIIMRWF